MPDLLLEIGTEELPAAAVSSGERQLLEAMRRVLDEHRLGHDGVEVFATPRRLAVLVRSLPETQDPATDSKRGPPVAQSFLEDGTFAPAAVGFARANGVEPGDLIRRETDGGEYLYLEREVEGAPTRDVLPEALVEVVGGLRFPKTMRWEESGAKFPRPVRWLVALFGPDVVPLDAFRLRADRVSSGHRVFHPAPVEIADASVYEDALREAGVVASRASRREAITAGAAQAAATVGGRPVLNEAVLEEVCDLVEHPTAVAGTFDKTFLEIPREVLVTAMESHQRYFAVEDAAGHLLPGFVAVSNGDGRNAKVVAAGNERVLRARLEDARFFFHEDLKISLLDRSARLDGIVLHEGLGTMRDKLLRIGVLLGDLVKWLGLSDQEADAAFSAADICKSDLTTHLVYEFPELQGVVGREYARRDPEIDEPIRDAVAEAVFEHYLPRNPSDGLPATAAGAALGIADRIDTLVGYLGRGLMPSGSEDPFALRRCANGLAQIAMSGHASFPLEDAARKAYEQFARGGVELAPEEEVVRAVRELTLARAETQLEREGVSKLFVAAAKGADWTDLHDLSKRARTLNAFDETARLHEVAVVFERCHRILRGDSYGDIDPDRFAHEAERDLYDQLLAVEEIARERAGARDYAGALEVLSPLSSVVSALFDAVLIDDEDGAVRRNRKALLERATRVFALVADFSDIEPKLLRAVADEHSA